MASLARWHSLSSPALRLLTLVALLLGMAAVAKPAVALDIAVVVHPGVKVDNVSFIELRKILRGDRQFWPSGEPVTLLVRAPVAPERTVLLDKIYRMSESQFRQYWIAKVFRAETSSGPKVVLSNESASELVKVIPGAVTLIRAKDVPKGAKVLKIDGLLPGDPKYPLHSAD